MARDPPEQFGLDGYADCLAGFLDALGVARASVAGLSFGGIVALAFQRRHAARSDALVLASAYAGWAGSFPPGAAAARLRQALALADGTAESLVDALLPTMFSTAVPPATVERFRASMLASRPAGFRAMARASAGDVRDVLAHIDVPTLVVSGARDERAPPAVARALHAAIPGAELAVLEAGHVCNVEAPAAFNAAVRRFLDDRP